jgi:hypothetical protein
VKGWKKNIPSKWKLKASKNSYSHIWQRRLQNKISQKTQRSLHIDKRNNTSRGYKNCKQIYTKCCSITLLYIFFGGTFALAGKIKLQIDLQHNNNGRPWYPSLTNR